MVLNLDNGIPVDQIAGLKPDLIVAVNAGVDADTYQKLSAIAPTIAQSDGDAFFEPWKDQATAVGQAVFQADQMKSLIDGVDKQFTAVAQKNPQWQGKKALLMQGTFWQGTVVATRRAGGPTSSTRWALSSPTASNPSAAITAPSSRAIRSKRCSIPPTW